MLMLLLTMFAFDACRRYDFAARRCYADAFSPLLLPRAMPFHAMLRCHADITPYADVIDAAD